MNNRQRWLKCYKWGVGGYGTKQILIKRKRGNNTIWKGKRLGAQKCQKKGRKGQETPKNRKEDGPIQDG